MDGIDWLSLCRRTVEAQREIFREYETSEQRTVYEGIGSGGDRTLVIDRLCEDVAFAELERLAGQIEIAITVVSEERGEVRLGATSGPDGEVARAWVVIDPIDGSLNARRTIPAHSFCLAVASGPSMADVDFGFVHDFGSGDEFVASRGEGALLNDRPLRIQGVGGSGQGESTTAESAGAESATLEVVGVESADPALLVAPIDVLAGRVHRLRMVGSIAITVCQVAAGRFDGMFSLRPCRSVDAAAAQLILREAGGWIELAPEGLAATGFDLDSRFPIRAARAEVGLGLLREAQELSKGFK